MDKTPQPVFIIGKHRSGTSWLGNLLAEHPEIYGVQKPDRHGIWESLYFTHVAEVFQTIDTTTETGFEEWADFISRTNYFRFSPLSVSELSEVGPAPFDVLFHRLMDRASRKKGATVWIEKSPPHTLVASYIAKAFPTAKFIAITRNFEDWLRSSIKHSKRTGRLGSDSVLSRLYLIAKLVGERVLYEAAIDSLKEEYGDRVLHIRYEDLRYEHRDTKQKIFSFTDVGSLSDRISSKYEPNSSFESREDKRTESVLSGAEWKLARFIQFSLSLFPSEGTRLLTMLLLRIRDVRGRPTLDWFFRPNAVEENEPSPQ
jgi:hypothetical protein